jgi:hypothetical protein
VAGRIEFAEIAVTFHLEDDDYHGYSNTECASDVDPRLPQEDPPTKPQYAVSLVESPDHNQDTYMFLWLRNRLISGQTIRHQSGIP